MNDEYEVIPGSSEQVEVFLDLQRMLVKLYNMWPDDIAIAVYSAACGSIVALIEAQYAIHVAECAHCQGEQKEPTIDLVSVARANFEFFYNRGLEQVQQDRTKPSEMLHKFFRKDAH